MASGTIVTAPGEGDVDYVCRLFAPADGIDEDSATGSLRIGSILGEPAG